MVKDIKTEVPSLEQVLIVKEFLNVFPEALPGMPPDREIEFSIDVFPNIHSISISPYRIAPAEFKELKE